MLGFAKKTDITMGTFRWLTVSSPEAAGGVELPLERMNFPPAKVYQKAIFDAGVPATAFFTSDISLGVRSPPDQGCRQGYSRTLAAT